MIDCFFAHLWRGGKYAFWWTAPGKVSTWFEVDKPWPALPGGQRNIYFGVNPCTAIPPRNSKGRTDPRYIRSQIAYIGAVNCLFSEFDAAHCGSKAAALDHVNRITPGATAVIDSGGGYHAYWLLREPFVIADETQREYIKSVQYRWVDYTGGDGGAKDLARVLRVPGTHNFKAIYSPNYPEVRLLRFFDDKTYTLRELVRLLPPAKVTTGAAQFLKRAQRPKPTGDDTELLQRARNAKNGARFVALFDRGDLHGYKSQSEADAALCAMLAFWTGGNVARVERLFRLSALFRDKWNERHAADGRTYGQVTAQKAVAL